MKFLLVAALAAAPLAAAPVFSPERVKAHVAFLADDLLEGRGTGTRGHEIAARYVAAEFAAAGLQPGAKGGSWSQPVTLHERRLGDGAADVTITGPAGAQTWANATEVVVMPRLTDAVSDVEGGVVFAGFGIDAPAQGYDDYAGLDVRGKFVAVLDGAPQGPPDETRAHLQTQKARMAHARGALGVINVPTTESAKRQPWSRALQYATVPRMTWVAANGKPHDASGGLRSGAALSAVAARALFAGSAKTLEAVQAEANAANARPKGFALATRARARSSAAYRTLTSPNVIGVIPGSDPTLKSEVVVLMAHLDHIGIGKEVKGDTIYNGALDNAAGIAVMLEVARAFGADKVKPKRTLMFAAVTAEEKGLLGAEALANDPPMPIASFAGLVNLDQPMLLYDFTDVIAFGADHSTLGAAVARAVARGGVELAPDPMPAETIFVRSDHYSFVKRGVPAVMLATGHANGGEKAWENFLATDYHQPSDDLKQPIDWAAGAKYARVNYLIARELADARERPRWYAGDFFGDSFAPGTPRAPRP